MQRHSKLITLKDHEGSNPKQKYTTQKNYIKIKIIQMVKMERVDGPLAHHQNHSKIYVLRSKK
jgi:hypothetical protein